MHSIRDLPKFWEKQERLAPIWAHVQSKEGNDPAHGSAHLVRVAHWALKFGLGLAESEELVAASLLHDLVNLPKDHPERKLASAYSAQEAESILAKAGFTEEEISRICLAIREHSFSLGIRPASWLSRAVQDADRIEALGAIGIFRWIATGAKMHSDFFHETDPWARSRPLDDRKFSLDHYFTKLKTLPKLMNTPAGKIEAERRLECMSELLRSLGDELGDPCESLL